jgi:hypothetical protein
VTPPKPRPVIALLTVVLGSALLLGCSGADDGADVTDAATIDEGLVLDGDMGAALAEEPPGRDREAAPSSESEASAVNGSTLSIDGDRSVIYRVDLVVRVDEVAVAADAADAVANRFGGYVQSESSTAATPGDEDGDVGESSMPGPDDLGRATLILRVPVERYADAVGALEDLGSTVSRSRDSQDVTEEVVDVESRIDSQQASIDRLRTLLTEAERLADILAIETELTRRQAELESLQARQKALTGQARLATIAVTFVPPESAEDSDTGFLAGLDAGWQAFLSAAESALTLLGRLVPFLLLAGILVSPVLWRVAARHRARSDRDPVDVTGPSEES